MNIPNSAPATKAIRASPCLGGNSFSLRSPSLIGSTVSQEFRWTRARSLPTCRSSKSWHRLLRRRELCVIGFTRVACLRGPSPLQRTTHTAPLQHNSEKPSQSAWRWRIWLHSPKEGTQFGMSKGEIMKRFSLSIAPLAVSLLAGFLCSQSAKAQSDSCAADTPCLRGQLTTACDAVF